jgi:ComF family protein
MEVCQQKDAATVDGWAKRIQHALWPSTCVLCGGSGRPGVDLCAGCEGDLPLNAHACAVCAQPLAPTCAEPLTCGACSRRRPAFDASRVPFRYGYPIAHLIHSLKYRGRIACGRVLGELVARRVLAGQDHLPECIVPVPLAEGRYRERGYNQAIELGLPLERILGVRMRADLVVRTRATREQAELSRRERRKNVRGAFSMRNALPHRHVAILDDVVTTGSTVNELAKALRRAGAERIEVWAVARAGLT